jgi:hypothetical protein
VKNGLETAVDGLLLPSVDTIFLARCSDPISTRKEWVRGTRMLMGGDRCALAEATKDWISDPSSENLERLLAVRERVSSEGPFGEDQM